MRYWIVVLAIITVPTLGSCDVVLPSATVSVRVVGEDATPIAGATVGAGFELPYAVNQPYRATTREAVTDESGTVAFEERTSGQVSYGAVKDGYYRTIGEGINFTPQISAGEKLAAERTLVLREIGDPVQMYARKVALEAPALDGPAGFDLEVGEWVEPYGRGKTADFVFTLHREWTDRKNFDVQLTLTFANPGDGIQAIEESLQYGSEFKLPRAAPESGYGRQLQTSISRKPGKSVHKEARGDRSYLYRVRTVLDEDGKVVSALYGKLRGDITLDPINSKTATIRFTYYLNPTPNDRNLEFDPERNLFQDLSTFEQVEKP